MAKKFTYMYAILIDGNFMKGTVYVGSKEDAYERLKYEIEDGLERLNKAYPYDEHYIVGKRNLFTVDGMVSTRLSCADDVEDYICYKVRKIRVPV